jgi:4-amino-4-deoxy-L-arabinose transferase-like glycosyltransferase
MTSEAFDVGATRTEQRDSVFCAPADELPQIELICLTGQAAEASQETSERRLFVRIEWAVELVDCHHRCRDQIHGMPPNSSPRRPRQHDNIQRQATVRMRLAITLPNGHSVRSRFAGVVLMRRSLVVVGATALCVRVGYVLVFMRHYTLDKDAHSYYAIGRAVSRGHGYVFTLPFEFVHATAIRPPLYPTVIASAFRVFGTHVGVAQGVNVVAGTAAAVLAALLGYRIAGRTAGLCAGIAVAVYPPLIANDVTVLVESFAVLLLFALVLFLAEGRTVCAGVVLGLLMLDRASAQWFVFIVAAWVLWRFGWRHAGRLVAVALLVVSPWVVRNWVHVGGPAMVTTNGFNINAKYSDEAAMVGGFTDGFVDMRFAPMRAQSNNEVDLDARLRSNGLQGLRAHPSRLLHVVWANFRQWFEISPGLNRDPERFDGRNLGVRHWTLPLFYVVTAGGIVGLVRTRRSPIAQLLGLAAAYFTVVSVVSVAVPRLRSLFDACMAVGAGVALAWLVDRRAKIRTAPPPERSLRAMRSSVILGALAIVVAASAVVWRAQTEQGARRDIAAALVRDAHAVDALAADYQSSRARHQPPLLAKRTTDQLRDLTTILGQRAPQVAPSDERSVEQALYEARITSHEADIIGILSAGEYLQAASQQRRPSLEKVRMRYETEVRPQDPTLQSWNTATSQAALTNLQAALNTLQAALT